MKNCKINNDTKIWLYKSAWQKWSECSLVPNVDVCISEKSFERKLLAIDMHISQINPPVFNNIKINSFKDIVNINNKSYKFNSGDSIWISPYTEHGFSGKGSLIKISNGECLDYQDIYEINKIYNYKNILKRIHKDNLNWGYENS